MKYSLVIPFCLSVSTRPEKNIPALFPIQYSFRAKYAKSDFNSPRSPIHYSAFIIHHSPALLSLFSAHLFRIPYSFPPRLKKSDLNSPFFIIHPSVLIISQSSISNRKFHHSFLIRFFRITKPFPEGDTPNYYLLFTNYDFRFTNSQSIDPKSSTPMPCYNFIVCKQMQKV